MKNSKFIFYCFLLGNICLTNLIYSQGVGIASTPITPDSKAILEIQSTTQGLLLPRMTTTQRDAITSNIPESLIIFNTTTKCFESYVNGGWYSIACPSTCTQPAPFANAATNVTSTSFQANWSPVTGASAYYLDVSFSPSFTSYLTGYQNLSVGNVTSYVVTVSCNSNYYFRVRASGACISGNSNTSGPVSVSTNTITDVVSNTYLTIQIGTQCWMAQNLRTTQFRNTNSVNYVTDNTAWSLLAGTGFCYYNNNSSDAATYGALYNFWAVTDGRGLCPTGWHVPTDAEWCILDTYLDPTSNCTVVGSAESNTSGGRLKETGTAHWNSPNTGASNNTLFTSVSSGWRLDVNGVYEHRGEYGHMWSSSQSSNANKGWYRSTYYNSTILERNDADKNFGFPVRCIKD